MVAEALGAGLELVEVLVSPEFAASDTGSVLLAGIRPEPVAVEERVLAALADADSPRGLLAVARLPRGGVEALPRDPRRIGARQLWVYADGLQDPGNLGALARVAEAVGAAGLALAPGSVHPNHPRALRASAGSLLRLPVGRDVTLEALDDHLSALSPRWACLVPREGQDLYAADLAPPLILAVGAEGPGLGAAILQRADLRLTIPLASPVESLNATVAAALTLFEIARWQLS